MPDVIIIGGGLSGLVAAATLEAYALEATLIEVKRQLGGSLRTVDVDGYRMDSGAFAFAETLDSDWLASLGLDDAWIPLENDEPTIASGVGFAQGAQSLIDALVARSTAPRMMRMAVSSVGELEHGRYGICLENGLLLDADAVIVAAPARYAERMFYTFLPEVGKALQGYTYDTIQRVSLGFRAGDVPPLPNPPDVAHVFHHRTTHPQRVPEGGELIQFGLRLNPARGASSQEVIDFLVERLNLPQPQAQHIGYWAEADPLSCNDHNHATRMQRIREQLPPTVALIGSDYALQPPLRRGLTDLRSRIIQGQNAAHAIAQALGAS